MLRSRGLLLAMASIAMACDPQMQRAFSSPVREPRRPVPPRPMTEQEKEQEKTRRFESLKGSVMKWNETRSKEFPGWKQFEVGGFNVVASNLKNAHKNLNRLAKECGLQLA